MPLLESSRFIRGPSIRSPISAQASSLDSMASGPMVKVLGWYDNEWGYSNRLVDLVEFLGSK